MPDAVGCRGLPPGGAHLLGIVGNPLLTTSNAGSAFTARENVGVCLIEGMTARAMCFGCIAGCHAVTSHQICISSDRFQMAGMDTFGALAEMIQLHPGWDRANKQFVRETMCAQQLIAEAEPSVAICTRTLPYPASRGELDERPKAANVTSCVYIHTQHYTMTAEVT